MANTTINRNINAINTDTTVSTVQPNGVLYTKEQGFIMTSSIFEVIRSAASSWIETLKEIVYIVLAVSFYVVTTVKLGRPFLLPLG